MIKDNFLTIEENVHWELFQEATANYRENPTKQNRKVWEVSYKNWREVFKNA